MSNPASKRRPPRPGPLHRELRTVLAGTGLPESPSPERARAHGLVLQHIDDWTATVEWFPSRSLRRAAAQEQMFALTDGPATRAQKAARQHLHAAIHGLLQDAGYHVAYDAEGDVRLIVGSAGSDTGPTLLAEDLRGVIAELGT